jgi:hypothetical protein
MSPSSIDKPSATMPEESGNSKFQIPEAEIIPLSVTGQKLNRFFIVYSVPL